MSWIGSNDLQGIRNTLWLHKFKKIPQYLSMVVSGSRISGVYCQLGDYMSPTTFYGNQNNHWTFAILSANYQQQTSTKSHESKDIPQGVSPGPGKSQLKKPVQSVRTNNTETKWFHTGIESFYSPIYGCFQKKGCFSPKMDGIRENPIRMDDLGGFHGFPPIFGSTPIWVVWEFQRSNLSRKIEGLTKHELCNLT